MSECRSWTPSVRLEVKESQRGKVIASEATNPLIDDISIHRDIVSRDNE